MSEFTVAAPAKINLTLEVLRKREDGYHEIASVLQTVGLFDVLTFRSSDHLAFSCDILELSCDDNLVMKAAKLLKKMVGYQKGAAIHLDKKIPSSAGLGGGSSDAASTLKALNKLWGLGLSINDLLPLALQLGSDVPFFLQGGTVMVYGRGERMRVLPPADLKWVVLLCPSIQLRDKTATMYAGLSSVNYTLGNLTRKMESRIRNGGDVPPQLTFNVFDSIACDKFTELEDYWSKFLLLGAREIRVVGSGPSLFTLVQLREQGTAIELMLKDRYGWNVFLVPTWNPPRV